MTIETIYFIHHSHTDIGYTHDQPILFDLEERFLSEAVRLADKYADSDTDGAFRWTVETTYVLKQWLDHAPQTEVDKFIALEKAGRIEVTGMLANLTPLFDTDEMIESTQLLRSLRDDYGFTIRHGMNCDVNGQNWPLVDVLLDAGIDAFSMAINTHFGGYPFERPNAFWWQGPSGRKLLTWNGWPYDHGWRFGIGRDEAEFEKTWWPRIEERLAKIGYSLPILMIQSYHPFGDNGTAFEGFVEFIDKWNAAGKSPRIRLTTPSEWWTALREHGDVLPTYAGDWTDYWNFGCISSAREQSINRQSRARLRVADALAGALLAAGDDGDPWLTSRMLRYRDEAWHNVLFWDEHTWGADCSIQLPNSEDTASQWAHKSQFAYRGRSLSMMLQRDALAALARRVQRENEDDILLVNPLPWPRTLTALVPEWVTDQRGGREDTTAGRQFQDRILAGRSYQPVTTDHGLEYTYDRQIIEPQIVPAFGYTVVAKKDLLTYKLNDSVSEESVVETDRHRIVFDRERGGVISWIDKALDREWVDSEAGYAFGGFVHEEVADRTHEAPRKLLSLMDWDPAAVERRSLWQSGWNARRRTPTAVLSHKVFTTPVGIEVVQVLEQPGVDGPVVTSVFLPNYADHIEFWAHWRMGLDTHPEATYLLFPFALPDATARYDLGGHAIEPGRRQLPGSCMDYFTVQNWVDFSNQDLGVIIATPDNPMVQLGDFHFAKHQSEFVLERPMLLGWVTNSYWETNFRPHQPGRVHARYRIQPHIGGFDEPAAHQFGLEAAYDAPLIQQMGEPSEAQTLPPTGSLLTLPEAPIQVLHVKPAADDNGVIVRLLNASDKERTAEIGSALFDITDAWTCNLFGQRTEQMNIDGGRVSFLISPRGIAVIALDGSTLDGV